MATCIVIATGRRTKQTRKTGIVKRRRISFPSTTTKTTKRRTIPGVGNNWRNLLG